MRRRSKGGKGFILYFHHLLSLTHAISLSPPPPTNPYHPIYSDGRDLSDLIVAARFSILWQINSLNWSRTVFCGSVRQLATVYINIVSTSYKMYLGQKLHSEKKYTWKMVREKGVRDCGTSTCHAPSPSSEKSKPKHAAVSMVCIRTAVRLLTVIIPRSSPPLALPLLKRG